MPLSLKTRELSLISDASWSRSHSSQASEARARLVASSCWEAKEGPLNIPVRKLAYWSWTALPRILQSI